MKRFASSVETKRNSSLHNRRSSVKTSRRSTVTIFGAVLLSLTLCGPLQAEQNVIGSSASGVTTSQNIASAESEDNIDIESLRQRAEQGNAEAQAYLGIIYLHGKGVEKDEKEAVKWIRKAAQQGYAEAQILLGTRYGNGEGVEQDWEEAVKWYRKAAKQENAAAQCILGLCYTEGLGVEKDKKEAIKWFRKAAKQGFEPALQQLKEMGLPVPATETAENNQESNAKTSDTATPKSGTDKQAPDNNQSDDEDIESLRQRAELNNAKAQYDLGICYALGRGVEKDIVEAVKWFRRAAQQGHDKAQYLLGLAYVNGKGVEKDKKEGIKWLRKAAQQGIAEAQYNLGVCYALSLGVEKDVVEAGKWFRKAANQGHAKAQHLLGLAYISGLGVEKDKEEGIKWFRKAAKQGFEPALQQLKKMGLPLSAGGTVEHHQENNAKTSDVVDRKTLKSGESTQPTGKNDHPDNESIESLHQKVEQDNAKAQFKLGCVYAEGQNIEKGDKEATMWYRKAAQQGNDKVKEMLKEMRED